MKPFSTHFVVPQNEDSEEFKRTKKQLKCKHLETVTNSWNNGKWSEICKSCRLVISSDALSEVSTKSNEVFL